MKGVTFMFNKIRYAYHLTACEGMIEKFTYISHSTYKLNPMYKWHKRQLNKLMTQVNNKQK